MKRLNPAARYRLMLPSTALPEHLRIAEGESYAGYAGYVVDADLDHVLALNRLCDCVIACQDRLWKHTMPK